MTLEQLRIFLEVAAQQHVTRAAQALNMTQSAVSAAVLALEHRHGVVFFDRVGRGIVLTEAGRLFVPHAQAVLRRATEAEAYLNDLEGGVAGGLRIQASQTVASYFLPPHLMRYRARYPQVLLQFDQGNTATVVQSLLAGEADLGVVEGVVDAPGLDVQPIAKDWIRVVVGSAHPWAKKLRLSVGDLVRADWVMREAGSGTRAAFDAALTEADVLPDSLSVLMELPSNEACIAAIETGTGATVLSRLAAAPHIAQGLIVEANFDLPARTFSMLTPRNRHQSRAAQAFIAQMAQGSSA
jgi:DNA-binding transcriptional LysR family regulator